MTPEHTPSQPSPDELEPRIFKDSYIDNIDVPLFEPSPVEQPKPKIGEKFLIRRSNGNIEEWAVDYNEKGEPVLSGTLEDGSIGDRALRPEMITPEAQAILAEERDRLAAIQDAHDEIDNMRIPASKVPTVFTFPPVRVNELPPVEPYVPDELDRVRRITVINGAQDPKPPKKNRWWNS